MTDETEPVEPQEEKPEATIPPEGEPTPEATQEKQDEWVTREELDRLLAQTKREVKQADKQRAKQIKAQMDAMTQQLEAAGIQVTPEAEQKLHAQIVDNLRDDDEVEPTGTPSDADIPPEIVKPLKWMAKQGANTVKETDPEYAQYIEPVLEADQLDEVEITIAFNKAVEAKKARTLQQKDKAQLRVPVSGEGPGEFVASKASQYYERAYKK